MKTSSLVLATLTCGALVSCNIRSKATEQAGVASKEIPDTDVGWESRVLRDSLVTPSDAVVFARIALPYEARTYCWYTLKESGTESLNKIPANPDKVKQKMRDIGSEVAKQSAEEKLSVLKVISNVVLGPLELQSNKYGADTPSELLGSLSKKIVSRAQVAAGAPGTAAGALTDYAVAKWTMHKACNLADPQKCESMKPTLAQLALLADALAQMDEEQPKEPREFKPTDTKTCPTNREF